MRFDEEMKEDACTSGARGWPRAQTRHRLAGANARRTTHPRSTWSTKPPGMRRCACRGWVSAVCGRRSCVPTSPASPLGKSSPLETQSHAGVCPGVQRCPGRVRVGRPRRIIPIMALPMWEIDPCKAEVARSAELGHKGVVMTVSRRTGACQDSPIRTGTRCAPRCGRPSCRSFPYRLR